MNQEKIGNFIKSLRESHNMTQEELASLIPISRQAISKWERGLGIPDSSTLICLSKIFDVSINEILTGEVENSNSKGEFERITLSLYDDRNKGKKIIKILIFSLILFIFLFLIYYFITSYKSIKVYTIYGKGTNVQISDGIMVITRDKIYFRLGDIIIKDDYNIKSLRLYYKEKSNEILYTTNDNILIIDQNGYNEYFEHDNIKNYINDLYLIVEYNDDFETIKLNLKKDYINDNFFKKNLINVGSNKVNKKISLDNNDKNLINKIKKIYKVDNDEYVYEIIDGKINKNIFFDENLNVINLVIDTEGNITETWFYDINNKQFKYSSSDYSFLWDDEKIKCTKGICDDYSLKIGEFFEIIFDSIK